MYRSVDKVQKYYTGWGFSLGLGFIKTQIIIVYIYQLLNVNISYSDYHLFHQPFAERNSIIEADLLNLKNGGIRQHYRKKETKHSGTTV